MKLKLRSNSTSDILSPVSRKSLFSKFSEPDKSDFEPTTETTKPTSLWDIVDRTRNFQMLYSGVEDERNFNILYDMGIRNFLISYHYVQYKKFDAEKFKSLGVKFFIDSGAFTYMSDPKFAEATIEDWEKQIKRYLNWVRKHKDIIFAIASFDLDNIVGGEQVQKWNEKYFEPFMLETGIPVCFVWHQESTKLSWEQYCQRYPYTGTSWATEEADFQSGVDMLRIAEKYNTVVHGMAMTKTSLLTKLPFYTVDSTTWMVGLQYGEVNYWTGQKMTRLKKDKWKGYMLQNLVSLGFNEQKLLDEDTEELIRVNVYAFIQAEKYIQDRCKSRMYWLKPQSVKRKDLSSVTFPSPEWINDKSLHTDWEYWAGYMNISKVDQQFAKDTIVDVTIFLNWDKAEYQSFRDSVYTPDLIKELHDRYVNRIVSSDEEMISDLQDFFRANLLGENDTLLLMGTNFDRIVKEREDKDYVTDDEYDTEDVSPMELQNLMSKFLPPPKEGETAPEIDSLDDEIFSEAGIVPVRDSNGRFLKGQRQVLKPKKLYSKKFPQMSCDMCMNAQKCPEYKAGYVCAYNKMFDRYDTRDMTDVIQAMQGIVDFSLGRLQRGMMTEMMNGGIPDPNVSGMMNQSMSLLTQLQRMYESGSREVLKQTKVIRSDGTQETTTSVSNPQSGGILAQIFGGMTKDEEDKDDYVMEEDSEK